MGQYPYNYHLLLAFHWLIDADLNFYDRSFYKTTNRHYLWDPLSCDCLETYFSFEDQYVPLVVNRSLMKLLAVVERLLMLFDTYLS